MAAHNNNKNKDSSSAGGSGLRLFMTPQLHLRTPDVGSTDNNDSPSSDGRRRPRGRPPGAKNKPKEPVIVMQDSPNSLRSHVLEVTTGADVVQSLSDYAQRRRRGVCILSGKGLVAHVTLRQPMGNIVTLHGRYEIISISGTVLPSPAPAGAGGLSVYLAGGQGQVIGGGVVAPLLAAGPVVLMAASFANAMLERLPVAFDEDQLPAAADGASGSAARSAAGGGVRNSLMMSSRSYGNPSSSSSSSSSSSTIQLGQVFGWAVTTASATGVTAPPPPPKRRSPY